MSSINFLVFSCLDFPFSFSLEENRHEVTERLHWEILSKSGSGHFSGMNFFIHRSSEECWHNVSPFIPMHGWWTLSRAHSVLFNCPWSLFAWFWRWWHRGLDRSFLSLLNLLLIVYFNSISHSPSFISHWKRDSKRWARRNMNPLSIAQGKKYVQEYIEWKGLIENELTVIKISKFESFGFDVTHYRNRTFYSIFLVFFKVFSALHLIHEIHFHELTFVFLSLWITWWSFLVVISKSMILLRDLISESGNEEYSFIAY